jgi:endonuclease YncB( thermonuclease family)
MYARQQYLARLIGRRGPRPGGGLSSLLIALLLALGTAFLLRPSDRQARGSAEVIDGDSLRVAGIELRLKGVDAPEMHQTCRRTGQPYRCGEAAREALVNLVSRQIVECRIVGRDRYQRALGRCRTEGRDIGARLVEGGVAVGYGDYEREEAQARTRNAGLWAGEFERPNAWRQGHPRS